MPMRMWAYDHHLTKPRYNAFLESASSYYEWSKYSNLSTFNLDYNAKMQCTFLYTE